MLRNLISVVDDDLPSSGPTMLLIESFGFRQGQGSTCNVS